MWLHQENSNWNKRSNWWRKQPKWNWTQNKRWNWSSCRKLTVSTSWSYRLTAQLVRKSEVSWVKALVRASQWSWVKTLLRQLSMATSKNPSVVNTKYIYRLYNIIERERNYIVLYIYVYIYIYIYIYKCRFFFDILVSNFYTSSFHLF